VAENRDRGRDSRGGNDRGRNANPGRDFRDRDNDRGRDFRGDRDRGGRFFNYRGRNFAAVRAEPFRYPRGWGYRHWARGDFLPRLFIAAPYFFDYAWLGLEPPPPGYRWVRYGPDLVLVNVYNGRIADVIYDAFY
jgi:Ni/Co efflux regulator RcnB